MSLLPRLNVWQFKSQWEEGVQRAEDFYREMMEVYDVILNDKVYFEMLGYILAVGNVLNGGSTKG